ncbi:MAG: hypothetical protein IPK80_24870 [Nannocystis sp.]|nr:hypothetical protein [Nannocystis sp.]
MRVPMMLLRAAPAALLGLLIGCAVYVEPTEPGACPEICGANASCYKGVCVCDDGYAGNAEAAQGCQPTTAEGTCEADEACGLNAYCSEGLCYCNAGAVAVCGSGDCLAVDSLCDGAQSCANGADEAPELCNPTVAMDWSVVDRCDDGIDAEWRLFAADRDWIWPNADSVFVTPGFDVDVPESIECGEGEWICFGATANDRNWGIGADGSLDCDDCCWECGDYRVDVPYLICD